jgi:prevent-host-death family protein
MISLENIRSLTDFRQNTKMYVERLQQTKQPLVLTVNGEAVVVVEDAKTFEQMQLRLQQLEQENRALKQQALQIAVDVGWQQAEQGLFSNQTLDEIEAGVLSGYTGK